MRVGIATCRPFGSFAFTLVEELRRRGHEPVAMFAGPISAADARGFRVKHGPYLHPVRLYRHGVSDDDLAIYKRFNGKLVYLNRPFNHPRSIQTIKAWNIDLLLNAGGPIYRRTLIESCGATILNCHMGLLPEVRGMNVAEWSVFHGIPIGNTVHIIRPGIDTGDIGVFFHQNAKGIRSIDELRHTLASQNSTHLATVVEAYANDTIRFYPQQRDAGTQYYRMQERLKQVVNARLTAGYEPDLDISERPYVRPAHA